MLVRLMGCLLVVASLLEIGLYVAKCYNPKHPAPVEIMPCLSSAIPAGLGFVILIAAKPIAEWISNLLDD